MPSGDTSCRLSGISKSYGSVAALKGVEFGLARRGHGAARRERRRQEHAGEDSRRPRASGRRQIEIDGRPARLRALPVPAGRRRLCHSGAQHHFRALRRGEYLPGRPIANPIWTRLVLAQRVKPYLDLVGLGDVDPATTAGKPVCRPAALVEIARLLSRDANISFSTSPLRRCPMSRLGRLRPL